MNTIVRTAKNRLSLLAIALISVSCAQVVKVHTPAAMFMTAESTGKSLGGKFLLSAQSGTQGTLVLTSNEIDNPMDLSNTVTPLGMGLDVGIIGKLDFYYRGISHESPGVYGLKYQFLGSPRVGASRGNHSVAFALARGASSSKAESDDLFDDDDSADFEAETGQEIEEAALLYSFRFHEDTVLYSNLRISSHELEVKVRDDNDPSIDGKKLDYETTSYALSVGIMRYFSSMFASIEVSAQKTDWTKNDPTTFGLIAGAFGWYWD